jgi:hypothetical protein
MAVLSLKGRSMGLNSDYAERTIDDHIDDLDDINVI